MSVLVGDSPATRCAASSSSGLVATDTSSIGSGAVGLPEGSYGVADHWGVTDLMEGAAHVAVLRGGQWPKG